MKKRFNLFPIAIILVLLFSACTMVSAEIPSTETVSTPPSTEVTPTAQSETQTLLSSIQLSASNATTESVDSELEVIIFDVGQADCALIKTSEHTMLIDAGNIGQDTLILSYLSEYGINKLDYLIASHPHADHIGSMAAVVKAMDSIGTLLMPDIIHTTATFESLLDAIDEKDISVTIPQPGYTFEMGKARIQVLAPNSGSYADLNDYSLVLRIEYGQSVFLFTGDAESVSEDEQLAKGFDVSADVLKVGHHGSHSSTGERYLESVSPDYAVISCGKDNSYGHPHSETVSKLTGHGVMIYRTDENGTVIFTTDGSTITAKTVRATTAESAKVIPESTVEPPSTITSNNTTESTASYIGNKNSKIFHLLTCGSLPAEKNRVYFSSSNEAVNSQYRPCKKCNPNSTATETVPADPTPKPSSASTSYIGNKNSKIFHLSTCGTLPIEKNRVYFTTRDGAVNSQYRPCQKCCP